MSLRVSIITPVYNQRDYIEETVTSILEQDYESLEYIVVDDGSTDGTAGILENYGNKLRLVRHANMGQYATVNKAFSLATGDIVGIVNSDDPLLEGAVSEIVRAFEMNPDAIVVYPDWKMIDELGNTIKTVRTRNFVYSDMLRFQECVPGPATFFRRDIFEQLAGRNPEFRFIADLDFWLRAGLLGRFMRLPKVLATFRMHPSSISSSQRNSEWGQEHLKIVERFFLQRDLPPVVSQFKNEAYASAYYLAGTITLKSDLKAGLRYIIKSLKLMGLRYFSEWYYIRRFFVIVFLAIYHSVSKVFRRSSVDSVA